MFLVPFLQVLIAEFLRPSKDRVAFGLGARIFGLVAEGGVFDDHRALGAVETDELAAVVVEVAAESHAELGVVVHGLDEVGELASIFEMEQSATGFGALRGFVGAGDEVNAAQQVNEEIAAESLAVVGETAPPEEADRVKGMLGSANQEE